MAAAAARCVAGPDGAANGTSALWRYRRVLGGAPAAAVAPGIAASCRAADGSLPPVSLTLPLLRLATAPVEPRRVAAPAGAAAGYPPPVDVMHWLHWLGRWAPAAATARSVAAADLAATTALSDAAADLAADGPHPPPPCRPAAVVRARHAGCRAAAARGHCLPDRRRLSPPCRPAAVADSRRTRRRRRNARGRPCRCR